jgi:transcriptional regulator with XRE-family HTH domain
MGIVATPQQVLQLIRAHGLTQAQIAERTGIPQPTISKIERGAVEDVMSRSYLALAGLLNSLEDEAARAG